MTTIFDFVKGQIGPPRNSHWGPEHGENLLQQLTNSIGAKGLGPMDAFTLFKDVIVPSCRPNDAETMLSFIPTAPTIEARMMDVAMGSVGIFASHWEAGAGAIAAENQALRWLSGLAGFPTMAGGCFVSGGSAANLSALVTARYRWRMLRGKKRDRTLRVALTHDAHASIAACAHVMDVELITIGTNASGQMDVLELAELLAEDQRAPSIFAVVANGGTTSLGIVDDLQAVADICQTHHVWMHVDAAYGGAALCAPSVRHLFDGIEAADSFSVDPHKWLYSTYDCAALIYRDPEVAAEAHAQRANYLDAIDRTKWNPADYAFHLSRRARGLPFWYSLAANGSDAYAAAVENTIALAQNLATMVNERPGLELLMPPPLSIVLFERTSWEPDQYAQWSTSLNASGTALVNPIVRDGRTYVRICLLNPLTEEELLVDILDTLDSE